MQMWKKGCLGLVLAASLTPSLAAQDSLSSGAIGSSAPAGGGSPLSPPGVGGVTPTGGGGRTIWDMLGVSKQQRQACKEYMCKTPIGQLLFNQGMKLPGVATGGLIGPCCPPFNSDDLNKPADSAEGAAARIKQDEADAKARRAAVRYLGTVDCHYWPEAQDALVVALRTDRNECVRWEAAMALGSGCCCTKPTIKALAVTVSSSEEDGNPAETSERVKAAAAKSLAHCLSCASVVRPLPVEDVPPCPQPQPAERILPQPRPMPKQPEPTPTPTPRPELPPELPPGEKLPTDKDPADKMPADKVPGMSSARPASGGGYYAQVRQMSMDQVLQDARRAQAHAPAAPVVAAPVAEAPVMPKERTLFGIFRTAFHDPAADKPGTPAAEPKLTTEPPMAPRAPALPVTAAPAPPVAPALALPPAAPGGIPMQYPGMLVALPPADSPPMPRPPEMAVAPPMVYPAPPMMPVPPMMPPGPALSAPQLVTMLRSAAYPDQREFAANSLGAFDGQTNPQAVEAVIAAARQDPAAAVRAACVRSLARMNVNTWPVLYTVQALKDDSDPRVKQEANQALVQLVPGLATPTSAPVGMLPPTSTPR